MKKYFFKTCKRSFLMCSVQVIHWLSKKDTKPFLSHIRPYFNASYLEREEEENTP